MLHKMTLEKIVGSLCPCTHRAQFVSVLKVVQRPATPSQAPWCTMERSESSGCLVKQWVPTARQPNDLTGQNIEEQQQKLISLEEKLL